MGYHYAIGKDGMYMDGKRVTAAEVAMAGNHYESLFIDDIMSGEDQMYLWVVYFVNIKAKDLVGEEKIVAESDQQAGILASNKFGQREDGPVEFWEYVRTGVIKIYPRMICEVS